MKLKVHDGFQVNHDGELYEGGDTFEVEDEADVIRYSTYASPADAAAKKVAAANEPEQTEEETPKKK